MNLYEYVGSSPLMGFDPMGLVGEEPDSAEAQPRIVPLPPALDELTKLEGDIDRARARRGPTPDQGFDLVQEHFRDDLDFTNRLYRNQLLDLERARLFFDTSLMVAPIGGPARSAAMWFAGTRVGSWLGGSLVGRSLIGAGDWLAGTSLAKWLTQPLWGRGSVAAGKSVCGKGASSISGREIDSAIASSRTIQGKFPTHGGPPHGMLVRRDSSGNVSYYQRYDAQGFPIKRVDLSPRSKPHGGVPPPHAVDYTKHIGPNGNASIKPSKTRPATPDEIP